MREAENEDERQIGSRRKTGGKDSSPDESRLKKQSPEYVDDLDEDAETELAIPRYCPQKRSSWMSLPRNLWTQDCWNLLLS